MKIGLIADPHFANHRMFAESTDTPGVNTRLRAVRNACRWAAEDMLHQGIKHAMILGDITHEHGRLDPAVWGEVYEALQFFPRIGIDLKLISGNHDMDVNGNSILPVFRYYHESPGIEIMGENGEGAEYIFGWDFADCYAIPYGSAEVAGDMLAWAASVKDNEEGHRYVFMHHSFDGAVTGPHEFSPPASLSAADIPKGISGVFSGHFHLHQMVYKKQPPVWYVGGLLQHDFGEAHYTPGYLIVEFDKKGVLKKITRRETPADKAPRFLILPHNLDPAAIPGNPDADYYRIDLPGDVDPQEVQELKEKCKHVLIRQLSLSAAVRSRVEEYLQDEQREGRITIGDTIDAYAAMNASDEERAKKLAAIGREIAKDVKS